MTRADLESSFDGTAGSLDGLIPGATGAQIRRLLRNAGIIVVSATSADIHPDFDALSVGANGDYTARFTSWVYHGRIQRPG